MINQVLFLTNEFMLIKSSIVARKSNKLVGMSISVLGDILFGHLMMPGTLMPPSNRSIPLPPGKHSIDLT